MTSAPLKIGFRLGAFPKLSETFIQNQIEALIERGHMVSVLADLESDDAALARTPITPDQLSRLTYIQPPNPVLKSALAHLPWRVRATRAASLEHRLLARNDVVICHFGWFGVAMAKSLAQRPARARLVTVFHGADMSSYLREAGQNAYDELFHYGDLHLPISDFWAERLRGMGAPAGRTTVHRMGVWLDRFQFTPRPPSPGNPLRLVSVGRLVEKKGVRYSLEALDIARRNRPDVDLSLDIVGDGPLREELEALSAALGLNDRVSFLGGLPHARVAEILGEADAFVLPSVVAEDGDMEGIPVALMEAMASGLPVVSTRHSGIPELVEHGVTGLLAPERDSGALADLFLQLAETGGAPPSVLEAARHKVEQDFSNARQYDRLDRLLRELVDKAPTATRSHP